MTGCAQGVRLQSRTYGSIAIERRPRPLSEPVAALVREGQRLLAAGQTDEALARLALAAERAPRAAAVLECLAAARRAAGQLLPALQTYDRLIDLDLATDATWCDTGTLLAEVGEHAQACEAFRRSLELSPDRPAAHNDLARALYRLGAVEEAAEHLEASLALEDSLPAWQNFAVMVPGCPSADHRRVRAVREAFARKLAESVQSPPRAVPRLAARSGGRPRVGYVSAWFHGANYMKPVWGLVNHHDREAFEIHFFSDSTPEQGMRGYIPDPRDHIHPTAALGNDQLAELIHAEAIDILVDLNAYSTPERLPLWLGHPAPVCVAWFNLYATSGLPGLDAVIGDREVVRPAEEPFYSERVLRLRQSYLTFDVTHPAPPVAPPPCLDGSRLTFGSLVSQYKITPPVLDAWAEILRGVDGSRLVLANAMLKSPHNAQYVRDQFAARGIDAERLDLRGPAEHYDFLGYYSDIDVALDAFPYNGGTTTMEAIWQGVPVLSFDGDRWASRTSQSLLRDARLGEFVAPDVGGYIRQAVALARDVGTPARLAHLRAEMRDTLVRAPACDTTRLARGMESLYRELLART